MTETLAPALGPETIRREVIAILAAQALRAPETLNTDDPIAALGIDSLGMAEVIFAIEERFDVAVPFDGVDTDARGLELSTVGGVVAAVERLLAQPAAG